MCDVRDALPWKQAVLAPLGIYALARMLSAVALLWASRYQPATAPYRAEEVRNGYLFVFSDTPPNPSYGQLMTNWDGQWYEFIATDGYIPSAQGVSPESSWAWAFPPGYPETVGLLMRLTGLPFTVVGPTLSLLLGAAAMVVMYRLLHARGGASLALTGVATTSFFISAPLLQAAYSESMALLLVVSILWACSRQRWWLATLLTLALSFVRLVTPPLAVLAFLGVVQQIRSGRTSLRNLAGPSVLGMVALAGPFIWPTISQRLLDAGGVGRADRAGAAARGFTFGWFGSFAQLSPWLLLPLALAVVLLVRVTAGPGTAYWGSESRAWGWSYPLFLLLVTGPTAGFIRYLLLAFPLGLPVAGSGGPLTRRRIWILVTTCVVLQMAQVVWIRYALLVGPESIGP